MQPEKKIAFYVLSLREGGHIYYYDFLKHRNDIYLIAYLETTCNSNSNSGAMSVRHEYKIAGALKPT